MKLIALLIYAVFFILAPLYLFEAVALPMIRQYQEEYTNALTVAEHIAPGQ